MESELRLLMLDQFHQGILLSLKLLNLLLQEGLRVGIHGRRWHLINEAAIFLVVQHVHEMNVRLILNLHERHGVLELLLLRLDAL